MEEKLQSISPLTHYSHSPTSTRDSNYSETQSNAHYSMTSDLRCSISTPSTSNSDRDSGQYEELDDDYLHQPVTFKPPDSIFNQAYHHDIDPEDPFAREPGISTLPLSTSRKSSVSSLNPPPISMVSKLPARISLSGSYEKRPRPLQSRSMAFERPHFVSLAPSLGFFVFLFYSSPSIQSHISLGLGFCCCSRL